MDKVNVSEADREIWQQHVSAIMRMETTGPEVIAQVRHAAMLEGVRLGLEYGKKTAAGMRDRWEKVRGFKGHAAAADTIYIFIDHADLAAILEQRGEG